MHKIYDKEGYGTPAYVKAQHALSEELMTIRFTAKTIEKLCDMVRGQVDDVRKKERELRRIIVDKCGMPQETFITRLPAQPAEPEVGGKAGRRRQALVDHHRPQHPADPGAAAEAGRPAVAAWWCRWRS